MKVSMKLFIRKNAWDISIKIEENVVELWNTFSCSEQ